MAAPAKRQVVSVGAGPRVCPRSGRRGAAAWAGEGGRRAHGRVGDRGSGRSRGGSLCVCAGLGGGGGVVAGIEIEAEGERVWGGHPPSPNRARLPRGPGPLSRGPSRRRVRSLGRGPGPCFRSHGGRRGHVAACSPTLLRGSQAPPVRAPPPPPGCRRRPGAVPLRARRAESEVEGRGRRAPPPGPRPHTEGRGRFSECAGGQLHRARHGRTRRRAGGDGRAPPSRSSWGAAARPTARVAPRTPGLWAGRVSCVAGGGGPLWSRRRGPGVLGQGFGASLTRTHSLWVDDNKAPYGLGPSWPPGLGPAGGARVEGSVHK